ncbi:peptidase domain-containing ABC transporter [Rhodoferax sp.]|uniref:peptidase domain-containing ABC transporter n=1 Tax=Rhodoferax sp. TaxID=50421 RepID=UPI0025FF110B|nr:peptidase domain-containing ABC transporter [Rhodoferax sp.]
MRSILQSEACECGLACLAMVSAAHKFHVDLDTLRRRFVVSLKGATLPQLMAHAGAMQFSSRALRLELDELAQLQLPCILHWDLNHFVVLTKVGRDHVRILDPAVGERKLPLAEVSKHFTGVALELTLNAQFVAAKAAPRVGLDALTGRVLGLKRSLAQIFALALALQVFAIAAPLLNQWMVDEAIATYDRDLLGVLIVGFGLLLLVQTALGLARSWLAMVLGMSLGLQWSSNLFSHLVRLPMAFFERRHLGDVVSRFGAIGAIQRTLTASLLEAVLDGLMSLATLGMMLLYSPQMAVVTLVSVALYGGLRWAAYRPFRDAAAERLVVAAREQTHFLESLRAIQPLKLFGREQERRARWQNLLVEVQNRDVRTAKMGIGFGTANTLIFGVENLLVLWLGAKLLLGLLTPEEGEVLYGGLPVQQLGLQNYRRLIGTVMQEDVLLAGSIADNISFFDIRPDPARIEACAQLAAVHGDIASMPMGYQTLVGDMGSSLSGGQKQRVLLARALYKQPKVLALDEATSHLDIGNEQRVTQALAQLPLTRIVVAHRPETIAGAQRVVQLLDGQVRELRASAVSLPHDFRHEISF